MAYQRKRTTKGKASRGLKNHNVNGQHHRASKNLNSSNKSQLNDVTQKAGTNVARQPSQIAPPTGLRRTTRTLIQRLTIDLDESDESQSDHEEVFSPGSIAETIDIDDSDYQSDTIQSTPLPPRNTDPTSQRRNLNIIYHKRHRPNIIKDVDSDLEILDEDDDKFPRVVTLRLKCQREKCKRMFKSKDEMNEHMLRVHKIEANRCLQRGCSLSFDKL